MTTDSRDRLTKVPAVTLGFWVIKILATTLGETAGDTVSMSWLGETGPDAGQGVNGYLAGTLIFALPLALLAVALSACVTINVYFPAAAILTGIVGAMVGFPALRLTGIYLVIATIAFAFIVEETGQSICG